MHTRFYSIGRLLLAAFLLSTSLAKAQTPGIIPLPYFYKKMDDNFNLSERTNLAVQDKQAVAIANTFRIELFRMKNLALNVDQHSPVNEIKFEIKPEKNAPEGYKLLMHSKQVIVRGNSEHGLFNGAQTLLQLIAKAQGTDISCWTIEDRPLYAWRGLMLDESRHFFGKGYVKSLLDWMAFYKLNRFHWHLTDEPGWRIAIARYPRLALVGGIGTFSDSTASSTYYTQSDISEIVAYANERFIQVIPEIDMPGHASAANRAYPEFSGGGSKEHPNFTFNPGNESTYDYISAILREINVLFPEKLIHIGGDEVSFGRENWNSLPAVKSLMEKNHLSTLDDVEHYFTRRIADSLTSWNTKTAVWDEAVSANLNPAQTTVFWWRQDHPEKLQAALDGGYNVILCPRLPLYFDFVQQESDKFGRRWDHRDFNPLEKVYAFPQSLNLAAKKDDNHILGIQANLWTETVGTTQRADYLLFPRIAAVAESAWTPGGQKNYNDFVNRLESDKILYQKAHVYYCTPDHPEPVGAAKND